MIDSYQRYHFVIVERMYVLETDDLLIVYLIIGVPLQNLLRLSSAFSCLQQIDKNRIALYVWYRTVTVNYDIASRTYLH